MKNQQLSTNPNKLQAARDEWQESRHDRKKHKAMREKRKNGGRGKAWQYLEA